MLDNVTIGSRLGETFAIDFAEVRLPMTARDLSMLGPITYLGEKQGIPRSVVLRGSVNGQNSTWIAELVRSEGTVEQKNRTQYLVAQVNDPYNTQQNPDKLPLDGHLCRSAGGRKKYRGSLSTATLCLAFR